MNTSFFPKEKYFWIYHGLILIAYTLAQVFLWIFFHQDIKTEIIAHGFWILLFTLIVLFFRTQYNKYSWWKKPTHKLIPIVFIYASISGLLLIIILTLLYQIFGENHIAEMLKNNPDITPLALSTNFVIGKTLGTQTLISAWIFIYISVTTTRRAKETEVNNLRLQNSLKEAQLNSLSNQLNPHFLFNALNNIRFMIHENALHADNMITALSEILRYSLESSKHEKVWLSQEIEFIERYIGIVKTQLENRLHFIMDVPHNLYTYLLPPMALQILVENAVKHGLDNMYQGGNLTVVAAEKDEKIIFNVTNDILEITKNTTDSMSIGLKNIEQRLHLLYGDKATLSITKTTTQFNVTMTLPKELAQ